MHDAECHSAVSSPLTRCFFEVVPQIGVYFLGGFPSLLSLVSRNARVQDEIYLIDDGFGSFRGGLIICARKLPF